MAYSSMQNATKCLVRARAEFTQAASELDKSGQEHHARTLEKWALPLSSLIEQLQKTGGTGGGKSAPQKPKPSPAQNAPANPNDLIV